MKNAKGITLIALIITIIIMLILAGVGLSLSLGENGIFGKAKEASNKYLMAQIDEEKALDELNKQINDDKNDVKISYSIINRNEEKLEILITIAEKEHGLAKIICPNEQEITCNNRTEEVSINYEVEAEIGKEYNFKILLGDGKEVKKVLVINKVNYIYTGSVQNINLNAGTYKMECYGARGGNGHGRSKGGYGGYTCGTIQLTQDTQLYLYIGQVGQDGDTRRASFNGGAIGGGDNYYGTENGGSGGGATDIRLNQDLTSRIIVAGGGGGAGRVALMPRRSWRNDYWTK